MCAPGRERYERRELVATERGVVQLQAWRVFSCCVFSCRRFCCLSIIYICHIHRHNCVSTCISCVLAVLFSSELLCLASRCTMRAQTLPVLLPLPLLSDPPPTAHLGDDVVERRTQPRVLGPAILDLVFGLKKAVLGVHCSCIMYVHVVLNSTSASLPVLLC